MRAHAPLESGGEALDPAVQRDVVDPYAALGQHLLRITEADRGAEAPTHRPQDHLGREAETADRAHEGHPGVLTRAAAPTTSGAAPNATEPAFASRQPLV